MLLNKYRCSSFLASIGLLTILAFGQSAETGSAFNKYMSPEGGINPMSGTVALEKNLASLSAGQISVNFSLKYSGNVFKEAKTANDLAPSGLVGLGWSFGRSQIVCDCKDNAYLDDDIYYLVTADGNRYKIFEEKAWRKHFGINYNANAQEKWWVEGNPFWKVERIVGHKKLPETSNGVVWSFVLGWKITDAEGITHIYGDIDEKNTMTGPTPNATEYDLIWAQYKESNVYKPAYGLMESALGGEPSHYPIAWNISREESLDRNYLKYNYTQVSENLEGFFTWNGSNASTWNSKIGYTKETYLDSVSASNGAHIDFSYEYKGQGDFDGEVKDSKGDDEGFGGGTDMFKERVGRKFLSSVEVYGENSYLGKITLCYSPLQKGTSFVKRLLSSVRFYNKDGLETDFEDYDYFTDKRQSEIKIDKQTAYPLGALKSIKGKNCGWVEYSYVYESMGNGHTEALTLDSIFGQGVLEDGTPYLVGKLGGVLKLYTRLLGRWTLTQGTFPKNITSVSFGDAGWFLAVDAKDGENKKAYVYEWNGKEWQNVGKKDSYGTTELDSPLDFSDYSVGDLVAGPDYVIFYQIKDNNFSVEIIWTKWGKEYAALPIKGVSAGGGYQIIAEKNHILVSYENKSLTCSGNCLGYYVYTFRNGELSKSGSGSDIDSENKLCLNGSSLVDVGEGHHIWSDSRVIAYNWNGHSWERQKKYSFDDSGNADLPAYGSDYYAVRYNDNRSLRTFYFDGETWNADVAHEKLLKSYRLSKAYYWTGYSGNDFFVTTRSYQRRWFTKVHSNTRIKIFYHKNGKWLSYDYGGIYGKYRGKSPIIGTDWFLDKKTGKNAWIWNGENWVEDSISSWLSAYSNIYSLGGNMFAASANGKTTIFYKINDSFKNPFGAYMVRYKTINEPVTDRSVTYSYSFLPNKNAQNRVAYDDATNTPLMDVMKIELPSKKGIVERHLCGIKDNAENVSVGSVCSEVQKDLDENSIISRTETKFERQRNGGKWPYPVYLDQEVSKVELARGLKTVVENTYSVNNGMLVKTAKKIGKKRTEEIYKYVADLASSNAAKQSVVTELKNQNRLNILAGSYSCVSSCSGGTIIAASASGLSVVNELNTVTSSWKYTPKQKVSQSQLNEQIENIALAGSPNVNWERQSFNSRYEHKQIVETEEGPRNIKVASFIENKERGKMYGNAANCGIDEGLMLSGETCNMADWTGCDTLILSGYSIDKKNAGNNVDYGRFSKKVIKLAPGKNLTGTIDSAKNETYRFSAWVQSINTNTVNLNLKINGSLQKTWSLSHKTAGDVGEWQYVEWSGTLSGATTVTLTTDASPNLRLQDIRILPSTATSTAVYWNEDWNKVQTKVDTRGVGSYVDFDELGREYEHFAETADGNVYLASKTTYVDGNCSAYANGSDELKSMFLNGKPQRLPNSSGNREATYVLSDAQVSIDFKTLADGDEVRYKLYPEGKASGVKWESPCCGELSSPTLSFGTENSWVLDVDVSPFGQGEYKFLLKKNESNWIEYGNLLGFASGNTPKYLNTRDSSSVIFKNKVNKLYSAYFGGNDWTVSSSELVPDRVAEFYTSTKSGNSYLAYVSAEDVPDDRSYLEHPNVLKHSGSSWYPRDLSDKAMRVENLKVMDDAAGKTIITFSRTGYAADSVIGSVNHKVLKRDSAFYAMAWNESKQDFEYVGSTPMFDVDTFSISTNSNGDSLVKVDVGNITSYQDGVVNDAGTYGSDMVVGPDNKLYVAYIGDSKFFYTVPFVCVKRLYAASENSTGKAIWAGVSQVNGVPLYQGDNLSWSDNVFDAIEGADQLKLAYDGNNLYLAVSYEVDLGDDSSSTAGTILALTVFKGSIEHNVVIDGVTYNQYLRWTPLKDESVKTVHLAKSADEEKKRVIYLTENDDFDFEVRNGIPVVMFRNSENRDGLSVISYSNNRWLSIGNPNFAYPYQSKGSADLGVNANGNPFVVFKANFSKENAGRKGNLVAMHYEPQKALDLTLSAFETANSNFNHSCAFRQYILNYRANLDTTDSFVFKVSPKTSGDVKEIQIYSNDALIKTVTDYSGYITLPLVAGLNQLEVRVVGTDGSSLSYNFDLYRKYTPGPDPYIVGLMADFVVIQPSSHQIVFIISPKSTVKSDSITFDLHFAAGWTFVLDSTSYTEASTVTVVLDSLPASAFIYNADGDTIAVTIKNSGAEVVDPTVQPWYISSSSSSSSGSGGNSSSSSVLNSVMSTNVPDEVRNVSTALIFASGNIYAADNVSVNGGLSAGNVINIGVTTSVVKNVYGSSVTLRNRANVQDVYYVSDFNVQDGAAYASVTQLSTLNIPVIPTFAISSGGSDILVDPSLSLSLVSGSYGSFTARANTAVNFAAGDYYFSSFEVDTDSKLTFAQGTRIWINGTLRIGDRTILAHSGGVGDLFIYCNTANPIYVGTSVQMDAVLVAPNAEVDFSPYVTFKGFVQSSSFNVQPNSVLE